MKPKNVSALNGLEISCSAPICYWDLIGWTFLIAIKMEVISSLVDMNFWFGKTMIAHDYFLIAAFEFNLMPRKSIPAL